MDETWTLGPLDPYPMTDQTPRTEALDVEVLARAVASAEGHARPSESWLQRVAAEYRAILAGETERGWNPALALIEDPDYVLAVIEDDDAG